MQVALGAEDASPPRAWRVWHPTCKVLLSYSSAGSEIDLGLAGAEGVYLWENGLDAVVYAGQNAPGGLVSALLGARPGASSTSIFAPPLPVRIDASAIRHHRESAH